MMERQYKDEKSEETVDYWGDEVGEKILPITELEEVDDWGLSLIHI